MKKIIPWNKGFRKKDEKCKVDICYNFQRYLKKGYCNKHYDQFNKYGKISKRTYRDKNEYIDYGDYYEVVLCKGKNEQIEIARAFFDKNIYEKVKGIKWCLNGDGYAFNSRFGFLHHLVLQKKEDFDVEHKNTNKLDNRKLNLRYATRSQNNINRKKLRGVYWHKGAKKWTAQITKDYKNIHLGLFTNKEDAIEARHLAEKKYFGEFRYKKPLSEVE